MSAHMCKQALKLFGICLGLMIMLTACSFPGMVETSRQLPQVSQAAPQPTTLPPMRFPQDEGGHNNLTEWWYYTGHLEATDAAGQPHTYGFELVVFQVLRSNLSPVYASHFAISDVTRGQFHFDQRRLTEPAPVPPGTSTSGIDIHVSNWSIQGLNGQDHLIASMQDYAINLSLSSVKPLVLHNGNGLITYGPGGFSY
ncbi:MAG TPA: carotenoid 1,2-hydratase, partial [Ktedonobacteraceae bacterium]